MDVATSPGSFPLSAALGRADLPVQGVFHVRQLAAIRQYRARARDRSAGVRMSLCAHCCGGATPGALCSVREPVRGRSWRDYRIDRHPAMRSHPVTPMDESDLRLHLARQTDRRIALLDIRALHGPGPATRLEALLAGRPAAVLFDGLDEQSLQVTGTLLCLKQPAMFAIGSSGLTYALIEYWRYAGVIPQDRTPGELKPVGRLVVISGSCSPATEAQIRRAVNDGFCGISIDPASPEQALIDGLVALSEGNSVVLYSALGPQDCAGSLRGEDLGRRLGLLLRDLLVRSGVRRAVIAGGDTSSHAVRQLGIHALTFMAQLAPGVPLCRGHAADPAMNGLELALKGGQVGAKDFFETALRGNK